MWLRLPIAFNEGDSYASVLRLASEDWKRLVHVRLLAYPLSLRPPALIH